MNGWNMEDINEGAINNVTLTLFGNNNNLVHEWEGVLNASIIWWSTFIIFAFLSLLLLINLLTIV